VRLLHSSHLTIQRAEAEMAVSLQRAHAECVGQGEGLSVVGFSSPDEAAAVVIDDLWVRVEDFVLERLKPVVV